MSGSRDFRELQRLFAAHLRDPERAPAPEGIEERRLRVYRELFFRNIEGFLANAFPVLRRITADGDWQALVRDFYARHRSEAPQFHRLAAEFVAYLQEEREKQPGDWPFLQELAHYEWVELALSVEPDPVAATAPASDLLAGAPVLSPLAWPLAYTWPVHRIGPSFLPSSPPEAPTHLVVYRDAGDEVRFLEINALTARLLHLIQTQPASGRALLLRLAAEMQQEAAPVLEAGATLLRSLHERGVLLGARSPGLEQDQVQA